MPTSLRDRIRPLRGLLSRHYRPTRPLRIVGVGGGFGLSVLLRGFKEETVELAAVVTVCDDGGSSGRLREHLDVIPPGDIRNCIVALADAEPVLTELFQYRFGPDAGHEIAGHSFGNLFLVALADVMGGMENAIRETSRILAVRGQILPSTTADVRLKATLADGSQVWGESRIPEAGLPVAEVSIEPSAPAAAPEAVRAILEADLVVLGPGSLFTSIIPNLLVPGIAKALSETHAVVILVVNVATQHGETDGYSANDHLEAVSKHLGQDRVDAVVVNSDLTDELDLDWRTEAVPVEDGDRYGRTRVHRAPVVDPEWRYRHDARRLVTAVLEAYRAQSKQRTATSDDASIRPD